MTLLAMYTAAFLLGFFAGRIKLRRGPVNVVRGILLPHPGDERWERCQSAFCPISGHPDHHPAWRIGAVVVAEGCRRVALTIDKSPVKARRYVEAVRVAQLERRALEAIS